MAKRPVAPVIRGGIVTVIEGALPSEEVTMSAVLSESQPDQGRVSDGAAGPVIGPGRTAYRLSAGLALVAAA